MRNLKKKCSEIRSEFDKISLCSDKIIKKLLREIDNFDLGTALYQEDESLQKKFLKNMSKRDKKDVEQEIKYHLLCSKERQLEVRCKILDMLRKIETEETRDR